MKKILIVIATISLLATSCSSDLDITPRNTIVTTNYFKTESDASAAISGVYSALTYENGDISLYGDVIPYLVDLTTDYMRVGTQSNSTATRTLGTDTYNADNQRVALAWKQIYRGIDRANVAIDNIPSVNASDTIKNRFINEAKFIRALLYFDAVRLWGEVPLVLHEAQSLDNNALKADRVPVDSIYAQIIKDLGDASNLPISYAGSDIGRATGGAALALLTKVYLTEGDWANAIKYARKVETGGFGYSLVGNFYDLWDPTKKNGKEHIFSAQFTYGQSNGTSAGISLVHCVFSSGFTNSTDPVVLLSDTTLFYDVFSDNDQRKNVSYAKHLYNPTTGTVFTFTIPRFRKYIDTTIVLTTTVKAAINFPVIRYADILLSLAEAINEQSGPTAEAYEAINKVRRRAFKYDINTAGSPVDLSGLTQEQFRDTLRQERYLEFVTEGQRWFDLARWKVLVKSIQKVPTYKSAVSKRNYLFPIPQTQRDLNPIGLWQNWGYDGAEISDPYDSSYQ